MDASGRGRSLDVDVSGRGRGSDVDAPNHERTRTRLGRGRARARTRLGLGRSADADLVQTQTASGRGHSERQSASSRTVLRMWCLLIALATRVSARRAATAIEDGRTDGRENCGFPVERTSAQLAGRNRMQTKEARHRFAHNNKHGSTKKRRGEREASGASNRPTRARPPAGEKKKNRAAPTTLHYCLCLVVYISWRSRRGIRR